MKTQTESRIIKGDVTIYFHGYKHTYREAEVFFRDTYIMIKENEDTTIVYPFSSVVSITITENR